MHATWANDPYGISVWGQPSQIARHRRNGTEFSGKVGKTRVTSRFFYISFTQNRSKNVRPSHNLGQFQLEIILSFNNKLSTYTA